MRRIGLFAIAALLLPVAAGAQGQPRPIVIRASTVLDGKGGVLRDVGIVIQGSKIVRIDSNPSEATYDLRGLTVMPGWIDTHTHIVTHFDRETGKVHSQKAGETPQQSMLYAVENAYKTFMAGFTTIQSPGAEMDKDLRDWIAEGRIPGPRVLTSLRSVTDQTGDPQQIRAFIRKAIADGGDFVKIFATASIRDGGAQTMTDAQIQAACDESNRLGKRSIVHAQGPEGAKAAVLAGCTSIEHGNRLTDEVLDLMVKRGVYFDSNNHLLLHNYIENKDKYLGSGNFTEQGFAFMEKGLPIGNETFKRALAKNVKMIFGTDGGAGAHGRNYEELVFRVRDGGQPPMAAIVSATSLSAESLRMQDQIGAIAPGMEADIIATAGNPVDDITSVRRVVFVMKGGQVYRNEGAKQSGAVAQTPAPPAVDVTAASIKAFIDKLPKDRISDSPIRVADVGGYKVGVYGVFRPKSQPGGAIRHETSVTEVYYMLEGTATLVTGGKIPDEKSTGASPNTKRPNFGGSRIDGGVTRKVVPGDVIVIPGNLPHWWSNLDSDIRYLIFRPDPEGLQPVR